MITRHLIERLLQDLDRMPAVALMGPRQVGKTTLAMEVMQTRPSVYLDLEDRIDLQKVENIKEFHQANRDKLIILDEVQRAPYRRFIVAAPYLVSTTTRSARIVSPWGV